MESIADLLKQVDKLKASMEEIRAHEATKTEGNVFDKLKKYDIKYKNDEACFTFHPLKNAEEKIKKAYIQQLMIIGMLHTEGLQENQYAYIAKLCNSVKYLADIQEAIRIASEKQEILINDFCAEFVNSEFRLCWILDALILIGIESDEKQREFLTELIYILSVKAEQINYFTCIAEAYLKNDKSKYGASLQYQTSIPNKDAALDYSQNICMGKKLLDGLIVDNYECCHYRGANKHRLITIDLRDTYNCETLVFENVSFRVDKEITFKCKDVAFINCTVYGEKFSVKFGELNTIFLEDSIFSDFQDGLFEVDRAVNILVNNSKFLRCNKKEKCNTTYYGYLELPVECGGNILLIKDSIGHNCTIVNNCLFERCRGKSHFGLLIRFLRRKNGCNNAKIIIIKNNCIRECFINSEKVIEYIEENNGYRSISSTKYYCAFDMQDSAPNKITMELLYSGLDKVNSVIDCKPYIDILASIKQEYRNIESENSVTGADYYVLR